MMSPMLENGNDWESFEENSTRLERHACWITASHIYNKRALENNYIQSDKRLAKATRDANWWLGKRLRDAERLYRSGCGSSPHMSTACYADVTARADSAPSNDRLRRDLDESCVTANKDGRREQGYQLPRPTLTREVIQFPLLHSTPISMVQLSKNVPNDAETSLRCDKQTIKDTKEKFRKDNNSEKHPNSIFLHERFYDAIFYNETKDLKDEAKRIDRELKIKYIPKKPPVVKVNPKRIVAHVENIKDVVYANHVKLFQNLLRGRTYHIMMETFRHSYKDFLADTIVCERPCKTMKTKLEQKVMANVSRFFDEIAKEAKMKFNINEDMKVYEIEKIVRIKREASEANRREMEIQKRKLQEKCSAQVLEIHEDVCDLFFEKVLEKAIAQQAHKKALKTTKKDIIIYSEKEIGLELLHGVVIPETYKNILGQRNDWDNIFLKSKGQQNRIHQPMPK